MGLAWPNPCVSLRLASPRGCADGVRCCLKAAPARVPVLLPPQLHHPTTGASSRRRPRVRGKQSSLPQFTHPAFPPTPRPSASCRNRTFCPSWKTSLHNAQSLSRLRSLLSTAKANPISGIIFFPPFLFERRLPSSGLLPVTS